MPQIIVGVIVIVLFLKLLEWVWQNIGVILAGIGIIGAGVALVAIMSNPKGRVVLGKVLVVAAVGGATLAVVAFVGLACGRAAAGLDRVVNGFLPGWFMMGIFWGVGVGVTWALWRTNRTRLALSILGGSVLLPLGVLASVA